MHRYGGAEVHETGDRARQLRRDRAGEGKATLGADGRGLPPRRRAEVPRRGALEPRHDRIEIERAEAGLKRERGVERREHVRAFACELAGAGHRGRCRVVVNAPGRLPARTQREPPRDAKRAVRFALRPVREVRDTAGELAAHRAVAPRNRRVGALDAAGTHLELEATAVRVLVAARGFVRRFKGAAVLRRVDGSACRRAVVVVIGDRDVTEPDSDFGRSAAVGPRRGGRKCHGLGIGTGRCSLAPHVGRRRRVAESGETAQRQSRQRVLALAALGIHRADRERAAQLACGIAALGDLFGRRSDADGARDDDRAVRRRRGRASRLRESRVVLALEAIDERGRWRAFGEQRECVADVDRLELDLALDVLRGRVLERAKPLLERPVQLGRASLHRRAVRHPVLDRPATGRAAMRHLIEQRFGAVAAHHELGDRVGVLLVRIANAADAAGQPHATTLLHHVRCFVRGETHIRCAREADRVARRVRVCADRSRSLGGRTADVRAYAAHVVVAERALDRVEVWERRAASGHAALGGLVNDVGGSRRRATREHL